jgi:hypothetical protein
MKIKRFIYIPIHKRFLDTYSWMSCILYLDILCKLAHFCIQPYSARVHMPGLYKLVTLLYGCAGLMLLGVHTLFIVAAKQYYSDQRYVILKVIKGSPTRLEQYQIKSDKGTVVQGYFNASDLLDANISKLPPNTAAKRSRIYIQPLPIRGQAEVDALLEHINHRPPSVRGEYTVEKIVDSRKRAGVQEYLVKWSGYPSSLNTWEPIGHLKNAKLELKKFNEMLSSLL